MSKDQKVLRSAVRQAVARAAAAAKENDIDESFSLDLGSDLIFSRQNIHPGQLSIDSDLFPTFHIDEVRS